MREAQNFLLRSLFSAPLPLFLVVAIHPRFRYHYFLFKHGKYRILVIVPLVVLLSGSNSQGGKSSELTYMCSGDREKRTESESKYNSVLPLCHGLVSWMLARVLVCCGFGVVNSGEVQTLPCGSLANENANARTRQATHQAPNYYHVCTSPANPGHSKPSLAERRKPLLHRVGLSRCRDRMRCQSI